MHICLKMSASWTGGEIYTHNLIRAIASLPVQERSQVKLSLRIGSANLQSVESLSSLVDQIYAVDLGDRLYTKVSKIIAENVSFIPLNFLNPKKFDFVYPDLAGSRCPYPWGGCIHDFQHYHLPKFFSKKEIDLRNRINQKLAKAAPIIVLTSQIVQNDFNHLYPEAKFRSVILHTITCPDPKWFELDPKVILKKYNLPDYFFLVSNQFWQHKNHILVIEAMGLLKQKGIEPTIVCTGNIHDYRHPDYYSSLISRIKELKLGEQIKILGLIPRLDQIQLMRRCLAVIQPSLFEGWGMVVEDARTVGKPILLSDLPVHREHHYNDAHFFDKSNAEELASLISTAVSKFQPGPDLHKEKLAKQDNVERVINYARHFLSIAHQAITNSKMK